MPTRPGYGVYGFSGGGNASLAQAVHAVKPGATTYSPATLVYQWCNGTWQLVWGAVVQPPPSVTAVYVPTGTKVTVTWTAPALNIAAFWTVRRPDGSVVATVPVDTLSVDDDLPVPGTGAYTVEGVNGSTSTPTASAPLTINVQPATVTATYQAPFSALVSWTPNAAQGAPDQWRVYNVTSGVWASSLIPGTVASIVVSGLTPGQVTTLAVYPFLSGVQGTGRNAAAAINVPAANPASVSVAWEGVKQQITLRWASGGGGVTNYEVQGYDLNNPAWVALGTTTAGAYNWANMSGQGYMRVRATSPGGVSDWVQVGPVTDTVGPYVQTPGVTINDGANPIITIRDFYDSQSINGAGYLQVSFNGGAWQTIRQVTANEPPFGYPIPLANRGQTVSFRLFAYDVWGNSSGSAGSPAFVSRPYGTFQVLATGVDAYTFGAVNAWRGFWIPYSDTQPTVGCWFYGDGWLNVTKGYAPNAASIMMIKNGSTAAEQGTHDLQLNTNKVYDGSVPNGVGGGITGPLMGTDGQFSEFALPASFYTPMGIGNAFGIMMINSGGPRRLYGTNLNSTSGRITFTFNA